MSSVKEYQLLLMQLLIFLRALLFHIVSDGGSVAMLPHGGDEVAARPERSSPELLPDLRTPRQDLACRQALDLLRQVFGTIGGHALHQKMDVIPIGADFDERNLVTLGYLQAYLAQNSIHLLINHHTAVLRGTHQVVEQHRDVMVFVHEAHLHLRTHVPSVASSKQSAASCGESTQEIENIVAKGIPFATQHKPRLRFGAESHDSGHPYRHLLFQCSPEPKMGCGDLIGPGLEIGDQSAECFV